MNFSQRQGIKTVRTVIQKSDMDNDLRLELWNFFYSAFFYGLPTLTKDATADMPILYKIWVYYFREAIDDIPHRTDEVTKSCKSVFFRSPWNEVYDLVEVLVGSEPPIHPEVTRVVNTILERNVSAYRVVDGLISEVNSDIELDAIQGALDNSERPVQVHLRRALELVSDRKNPDYRNSIKESISAVEAYLKMKTGKNTLSHALQNIDKTHKLHPALKHAFEKLYAYTSDAHGIRHALMEDSTVGSGDAMFMLVSCSAFISYLRTLEESHPNCS